MLLPDHLAMTVGKALASSVIGEGQNCMEVYFGNLTAKNAPLDQLAEDVSLLVHDAEELVHASGAKLSARSKAELENALERVKTRGERVKQQALAGARATDRIVRQYPYQSLAVVFSLGFILGAFLKRK